MFCTFLSTRLLPVNALTKQSIQFNQAIIEDNRNLFIIVNLLEAASTILKIYLTNAVNIRLTFLSLEKCTVSFHFRFFSSLRVLWLLNIYSSTLLCAHSNVSGFFLCTPCCLTLGRGFHNVNFTFVCTTPGGYWFETASFTLPQLVSNLRTKPFLLRCHCVLLV